MLWQNDDRNDSLGAGFDALLVKPVEFLQLEEVIARLLQAAPEASTTGLDVEQTSRG